MSALGIAMVTGAVLAGTAWRESIADEPDDTAAVQEAAAAEAPIVVKLIIADERDGKKLVVQRPRIEARGGRPATAQFGNMLLELVAVAEPETAVSPAAARLRQPRPADEEALPPEIPIHVSLLLRETQGGRIRTRARFQLRTVSGETATVKSGGLEVQVTAEAPAPLVQAAEVREFQEAERIELRIYRNLQKRVSVNYEDIPLSVVFKDLSSRSGLNFVFDPFAFEDAGLTPAQRVSLSENETRVATLLDQLLIANGLDYVVGDDVIKITTRRRARGELSVRLYPVADLLEPAGPGDSPHSPDDVADALWEQITSEIAPDSWDQVGGQGGVRYLKSAKSFAIRQTANVHDEITYHFSKLRSARTKRERTGSGHVEAAKKQSEPATPRE